MQPLYSLSRAGVMLVSVFVAAVCAAGDSAPKAASPLHRSGSPDDRSGHGQGFQAICEHWRLGVWAFHRWQAGG
jgi:hypothetical protein